MNTSADGRGRRPSRTGSTVTMREVAELAGVSTATVSHVVNNTARARVGDAARERVRDAIVQLGYRPNAFAQSLVRGHSQFIGLVADAIATTPFAGQIIRGAQDEAWKRGYVLLVANTDSNQEAEDSAIAMMLEHQVRGILYSSWYHRRVSVPAGLQDTEVVLVNCFADDPSVPAVIPDEQQGGSTATQMLLDAGHTRVMFINTTTPSPAQEGRLAGYRQALADAGIAFDPALVIDAEPAQEGGYDAARHVKELGASAVFCHNDRVAMGLYDGLSELGVRVPDDVAVVGFDNQEIIAAHVRPPLSTVALPHYELGVAGVRALLGLDEVTEGNRIVVACPPVPRASV